MIEPTAELSFSTKTPRWDFKTFQKNVVRQVSGQSFYQMATEFVRNKALERVGKREKEAKLEITTSDGQNRLVFRKNGEVFDPAEKFFPKKDRFTDEEIKPIEVKTVKGTDFDARAYFPPASRLELPEKWLDPHRPHQGIKALHELAHMALFLENPAYQYVRDDFRMQQLIAGWFLTESKRPVGELVGIVENLVQKGDFSNFGITDKEERTAYIRSTIDKFERVAQEGKLELTSLLGQTSLLMYLADVELERNTWALALNMLRDAKKAGFVIDNRPTKEIFKDIDVMLATRVTPGFTAAVKRPSSRKELGLPEKPEEKPIISPTPLEDLTGYLREVDKAVEKAGNEVRDYLHLNDEDIDPQSVRLTPISQIDSRIIKTGSWLFGADGTVTIDQEMESLIRICCSAFHEHDARWQKKHLQEFGEVIFPDERVNWTFGEGRVIVGDIKVSSVSGVPERYTVTFLTARNGGGKSPESMESNTVIFDRKPENLDEPPAPIADRGDNYYFARRVSPEGGFTRVGWQIVGEMMSIYGEAMKYAEEKGITQDKLKAYLESQGYDSNTIGELWMAYSGHAGFLRKPEVVQSRV